MKNKGKYYQHTHPGNPTIVLCTEDSDSHTFSGVCVREGSSNKLGHCTSRWTSYLFNDIKFNNKSIEEKINDELLEIKKKMSTFDDESPEFKCHQNMVDLLNKLKL